ncbi:hypothetical protein SAMN05216588_101245 [Pseudomonas flavescens]|uniref:Uncharacterized protein n=1 Tax=Phytopseudomonas flavescens TaxID=29435 RepID=A0A1G7XRR9_9GAMM|nr:hypothetical protein [Pseudomonas flavescens]SDG86858.1 hypothetical protein SAMN05216588_101245 [Pseudomonas flavescens]
MTQQTLQQLLTDRILAYTASARPAELIDAGIDKMFKEVIDDTFRSYGDFTKMIKEAVKAALPANVSDFVELDRYNALISNALKERWSALGVESSLVENAHKAIDEIFSDGGVLKAEYGLRELIQAFIDDHKEEAAENRWEAPEVRLEEVEQYGTKFIHLYFDPEPESSFISAGYQRSGRSEYQLKHAVHMRVEEERDTGDRWRESDQICDVYSAKLDDKKIGVAMRINTKWERIIAALYFGNAKLVVDCDPQDFSYGLYE